jgi:hypothetical protein
MTTIMIVLVAIFAVAMASVVVVALSNRVMFKMGLRNLPRRGLQTGLVVVGLMLATLITTAAFTTGDTIDYSISNLVYNDLQRTDLVVNPYGETSGHEPGERQASLEVYYPQDAVATLDAEFASDPDVDGFLPFCRSRRGDEPANQLPADRHPRGVDPSVSAPGRPAPFDGARFDLARWAKRHPAQQGGGCT